MKDKALALQHADLQQIVVNMRRIADDETKPDLARGLAARIIQYTSAAKHVTEELDELL